MLASKIEEAKAPNASRQSPAGGAGIAAERAAEQAQIGVYGVGQERKMPHLCVPPRAISHRERS